MEKIETIEERGHKIHIYPDYDADSPEGWKDPDLFVVGFHDQFHVPREGIDRNTLRAIACGGKYEDGSAHSEARELMKAYRVYRLDARIYSSADNPHLDLQEELTRKPVTVEEAYDRYDSYYFGAAFVSRKEARYEKTAFKRVRGLLEEWDDYLRGNVYRYEIETPEGDIEEACSGFYGYPYTYMLEEAKSELKALADARDEKRTKAAYSAKSKARIYDNGGKTADRYTILYGDACYGMSADPKSPQGFNQYCGDASKVVETGNEALGKRVKFQDLPEIVREAIIDRIA